MCVMDTHWVCARPVIGMSDGIILFNIPQPSDYTHKFLPFFQFFFVCGFTSMSCKATQSSKILHPVANKCARISTTPQVYLGSATDLQKETLMDWISLNSYGSARDNDDGALYMKGSSKLYIVVIGNR